MHLFLQEQSCKKICCSDLLIVYLRLTNKNYAENLVASYLQQ